MEEEEQAPEVGAKANYGDIKARAGAILLTIKDEPGCGHNDGHHRPGLYCYYFIERDIGRCQLRFIYTMRTHIRRL